MLLPWYGALLKCIVELQLKHSVAEAAYVYDKYDVYDST